MPNTWKRLQSRARDAAARTERYLCDRQSSDGGFCFYRWQGVDEPNLHDTWHAVAALKLFGANVPRSDAIASFLATFDPFGVDDLYHWCLTFERLGCGGALDPRVVARMRELDAITALTNDDIPVSARLERTLRILRLQRCFATIRAADEITRRLYGLRHDGGWGEKTNLGDTSLALAILSVCGAQACADTTREFVDSLQVAAVGFTATRDSRYEDLHTVHAGMRACAVLELPVRYVVDAVGFVLACQSANGGFGRTPDALPNIALTHQALQTLILADALPMHA